MVRFVAMLLVLATSVVGMSLIDACRADTPLTAEAVGELYVKGDWKQAAAEYERLTQEQPTKGQFWFRLANCRLMLKEHKKALNDFEKALSCGAPEGQVRFKMALSHAALDDRDAALDALEKGTKLGFPKAAALKAEEGLTALREMPRFKAILDRLENPTRGLKGANALDHWIGEWDVYSNGQFAGRNRVAKSLDGFAVEEFWENAQQSRGRSLFVFEASKGRWKQLWTSDAGWVVEKIGTPIENGIFLEGTSTFANGATKKSREHLTKNADSTLRQHLEDWDEATQKWTTSFDAKYVRRKEK